MRIGIDIRSLSAGKHTGVEEYIYNLLPHLFSIGKKDKFILLYNSYTKPLPQEVEGWKSEYSNVEVVEKRWPSKILNACLWHFNLPKLENWLGDIDVFFLPNFGFISTNRKIPRVVTFHDLAFEYSPHFLNYYRRLWHWLVNPRMQARRAKKIITVSKSTKSDLNKLYKVSNRKINVIPLGVAEMFFKKEVNKKKIKKLRDKYGLGDKPYILFLGTIEPRKNIASLIKAFNEFKKRTDSPHKLVIAGTKGWLFKKVFETASNSPYSQDIIFPDVIDTEDRSLIYKEAELFVFPSFFEGFGLPPLEALASGTPVICSNNTSLLENIGSHSLLVNPHDIGEISWAIERAVNDKSLNKYFQKNGIEHAKQYKWRETAKQTLKVLRKAKV